MHSYSNCVIASNCLLSLRCFLVSFPSTPFPEALTPSCRTSTPGPADLLCGNTYSQAPRPQGKYTFAPLQPHRKANSCANISPKPSITPFINGRIRLIAAVRRRERIVGGLENVIIEFDEFEDSEVGRSEG